MANGLTLDGLLPALYTRNRPPAISRSNPSAIWERAELPMHRISTCSFIVRLPSVEQYRTNYIVNDYSSQSAPAGNRCGDQPGSLFTSTLGAGTEIRFKRRANSENSTTSMGLNMT